MSRIVVEQQRLAWYRHAADTPEFWSALWRAHPPKRVVNHPIHHWYRRVFTRHLPTDGPIVEAGCGNGFHVRCLADAGYRVEGLDFAAETIEANRAVDPDGSYRCADVRDLPYDDASLGGYISLGVIEHFRAESERTAILREAARCLRPSGIAIITTPYFSPLRRLRAAAGGFRARTDADHLPFYQFAFTRRDLAAQLAGVGLTTIDADAYDVYKGIKDTIGGKRILDRLGALHPRIRRGIEHPARPLRMLAAHMLILVARRQP